MWYTYAIAGPWYRTVLSEYAPPAERARHVIIDTLMMEAFGVTDKGCVRTNNEDAFLTAPDIGLYMVADGMGGALAGERASELAIQTVEEVMRQAPERSPEALVEAFQEANRRVRALAGSHADFAGMGTTLVAAQESGDQLLLASVGDSRGYILEDGELRAITEDQTWVNEVGRRLGIAEEALRQHPMRHVLTMAVGLGDPLRVHSYTVPMRPGTQVILATDGLHGVVDTPIIAEVIKKPISLETQGHYLLEAARKAGGPDNITVVLLRSA